MVRLSSSGVDHDGGEVGRLEYAGPRRRRQDSVEGEPVLHAKSGRALGMVGRTSPCYLAVTLDQAEIG
jgi:hypothetical protein